METKVKFEVLNAIEMWQIRGGNDGEPDDKDQQGGVPVPPPGKTFDELG